MNSDVAQIQPSRNSRAGNISMSLESHLADATFGENISWNGFDYFKVWLPRRPPRGVRGGVPGGPPGGPCPPQYILYIRTRCKSQGLRKSKRNACSGYCKSGILLSGWVLRRGGRGQLNLDSAIRRQGPSPPPLRRYHRTDVDV